MKLAKTARLECNKRSSNGLGDWEVGRVNLVELATLAANLLGLMVQSTPHVCAVLVGVEVGCVDNILVAYGAVDNVRRRGREVLEDGLVHTEVAGENVLRGVSQPVVNVEGCSS